MKNKLCELSIKYKPKAKRKEFPFIKSSSDAFDFIWEYLDQDLLAAKEEFWAIYLNRANKVKGVLKVSSGGVTATVVDVKIILATALKSLSSGIILVHNHPSGSLKASEADKITTKKVKDAGKVMDIEVLDHLILSPEGKYLSFADEGIK